MNCDLCKENTAVIFIEQESNSGKKRISLCKSCAEQYKIQPDMPLHGNKEIIKLFDKLFEAKTSQDPEASKLCPVCGRSLLLIRKTGITGCSECYQTFPSQIHEMLKTFDVDQIYSGSLPKRLSGFRNTLTDRMDIQLKLEKAIQNEDYEKAAVYRDFLKALDKGCVADGEDSKTFQSGLIGGNDDSE